MIGWGVLGTGRISRKLAMAINKADGATLRAVGSRDADRAAKWASEFECPASFGSYESIIAHPDVDAVYIALPPSMHREWATQAANNGKHVLCEKPLAATAADAEAIVAACDEHNVQLMDGVMWYHHPRAQEMLSPIRAGKLGELRRLTSAFSFAAPPWPETEFRLHREHGGGSLLDLGWYCVGAALWFFDAMPIRVRGEAQWKNDIDLRFSGWMEFPEERVASFDCAFDTAMRKWIEVAGTAGSLVCDDFPRPWDEANARFWLHGTDGKMSEHISAAVNQETRMVERFSQIVLDGRREPLWAQRSLQTQQVCEALDQSAREGQTKAM